MFATSRLAAEIAMTFGNKTKGVYGSTLYPCYIGVSFNGRTTDFDSVNLRSIRSALANMAVIWLDEEPILKIGSR